MNRPLTPRESALLSWQVARCFYYPQCDEPRVDTHVGLVTLTVACAKWQRESWNQTRQMTARSN